jgi:hypothetical protein
VKPLNLDPIRRFVEAQMTDTILITRDNENSADDTFDTLSGKYIAPVNDFVTIYEGPASISVKTSPLQSQGQGVGPGEELITKHQVEIPISAPHIQRDDIAVVTASVTTPHIVGLTMIIMDRLDTTDSISQIVRAQAFTGRRPR